MSTGLHHVQITIPVGMESQARDFYCGVMQFTEVPKPASLQGRGGFWFSAGDVNVHVGVEDGVDRTQSKAHVAYEVRGLEQWRQLLQDAGIAVVEGVPIPGFDRFEFRDPFGNRVELIEPAA